MIKGLTTPYNSRDIDYSNISEFDGNFYKQNDLCKKTQFNHEETLRIIINEEKRKESSCTLEDIAKEDIKDTVAEEL